MISMNIKGMDSLAKLSSELKKAKQQINREGEYATESLYKNISVIFERQINDLVYEQYDPESYKRTFHLAGGHGAKDESVKATGLNKSYEFSIDEDSNDPVDGTTWREKADAVERGATEMRFRDGVESFNRPFINETQKAIEWENKRTADAYERSVNNLIDKIMRG